MESGKKSKNVRVHFVLAQNVRVCFFSQNTLSRYSRFIFFFMRRVPEDLLEG